jgi:hypothetical protein
MVSGPFECVQKDNKGEKGKKRDAYEEGYTRDAVRMDDI